MLRNGAVLAPAGGCELVVLAPADDTVVAAVCGLLRRPLPPPNRWPDMPALDSAPVRLRGALKCMRGPSWHASRPAGGYPAPGLAPLCPWPGPTPASHLLCLAAALSAQRRPMICAGQNVKPLTDQSVLQLLEQAGLSASQRAKVCGQAIVL